MTPARTWRERIESNTAAAVADFILWNSPEMSYEDLADQLVSKTSASLSRSRLDIA
jgi:hypothetical protein